MKAERGLLRLYKGLPGGLNKTRLEPHFRTLWLPGPTLSAYLLLETVSLTDQLSRQTDLGALFFFCLSPHHQCSVDRLCVRCLNTYDPMEARR